MKTAIIFLDIGGVMIENSQLISHHLDESAIQKIKNNSHVSQPPYKEILENLNADDLYVALHFSHKAVNHLKQLCEQHSAKIVLVSAWRKGKTLEQMKALLSLQNLDQYFLDNAPDLKGACRAEEVADWLVNHASAVESFVILDDINSGYTKHFRKRFVHCSQLFEDEKTYQKAAKLLATPVTDEEIY